MGNSGKPCWLSQSSHVNNVCKNGVQTVNHQCVRHQNGRISLVDEQGGVKHIQNNDEYLNLCDRKYVDVHTISLPPSSPDTPKPTPTNEKKFDFDIPSDYKLFQHLDLEDFDKDGSDLSDVEDYIQDKFGSLEIYETNEKDDRVNIKYDDEIGMKSLRIKIDRDDGDGADGSDIEDQDKQRTEIKARRIRAPKDSDWIYLWWFKVPKDYKTTPKYAHIFQLKGVTKEGRGGDSPLMTFFLEDDDIRMRVDEHDSKKIADVDDIKGEWIQAYVKVHYDDKDDGSIEVELKDDKGERVGKKLKYDDVSTIQDHDKKIEVQPKYGWYRSFDHSGGRKAWNSSDIIKYANFKYYVKEGSKSSSFDDSYKRGLKRNSNFTDCIKMGKSAGYRLQKINNISLEQCAQACIDNDKASHFDWYEPNGNCYLRYMKDTDKWDHILKGCNNRILDIENVNIWIIAIILFVVVFVIYYLTK